jgi:hypothetical protein
MSSGHRDATADDRNKCVYEVARLLSISRPVCSLSDIRAVHAARGSRKLVVATELPVRAKLALWAKGRRIVKKPRWLRSDSSDTRSDNLKKVRRRTDQRMKQQDTQKEQRDEAEKKNQLPSIGSARDRQAGQRHQ